MEYDLKAANPDLEFYLVGQAHYGEVGFAFIEVMGLTIRRNGGTSEEKPVNALKGWGFPLN